MVARALRELQMKAATETKQERDSHIKGYSFKFFSFLGKSRSWHSMTTTNGEEGRFTGPRQPKVWEVPTSSWLQLGNRTGQCHITAAGLGL